jgi:Phosphotransferase system, mannose/fructose/N-acetylgalactosamine-specific component IID
MTLSTRLLMRCFLRSYLVGAAYNPHGLQNIGFLHAIDPGLSALFRNKETLRDARLRYATHFNSHPFFTPLLLGMYLRMELAFAAKGLPPDTIADLKDTAANTLSGIGDSFFSGACLNTWALLAAILICLGQPATALILMGCLLLLVQIFKLATFILGWRQGIHALILLKRLDIINWGERLKLFNAVLLAAFLWFALPGADSITWLAAGTLPLALGWITGKWNQNRVILVILLALLAVSWILLG